MIIGTGLLASSFRSRYAERDDVVVFASGVSNSTEQDPLAFSRERELLADSISRHGDHACFVYFGSCGVASRQQTPYIAHKRAMEHLVTAHPHGLVLRLPQVVGPSSNPNTLTNFLSREILAGHPITIWRHAERNLIDIDDIVPIASAIIERHQDHPACVAIASSHTLSLPELVSILERVLRRKARLSVVDKGEPLAIDTSASTGIARRLGIAFGPDYAEKVLRKYYGNLADA